MLPLVVLCPLIHDGFHLALFPPPNFTSKYYSIPEACMATPWGDSPYPPVFPRPSGQRPRHPALNPPPSEQDPWRSPAIPTNVPPPGPGFPSHNDFVQFPQPNIMGGGLSHHPGPIPQMPIPMILRPGASPRNTPPVATATRSNSYFFEPLENTNAQYTIPSSAFSPPLPQRPNIHHTPAKPLHAEPNVPPTIPPKPVLVTEQLPQLPAKPYQMSPTDLAAQMPLSSKPDAATVAHPAANPAASSPAPLSRANDPDEVLQRVLALSVIESEERQRTLDQEDEELARALEESLAITSLRPRSLMVPSSQHTHHRPSSSISSPVDIPVSFWSPSLSLAGSTDTPTTPASFIQYIPEPLTNKSQSISASYEARDKAFPHPSLPEERQSSQGHEQGLVPASAAISETPNPPQYDEIIGIKSTPASAPVLGRSVSAQPAPPSQATVQVVDSRRAQSFTAVPRSAPSQTPSKESRTGAIVEPKLTPPTGVTDVSTHSLPQKLDVPPLRQRQSSSSINTSTTDLVPSANHYIDQELLLGVCELFLIL